MTESSILRRNEFNGHDGWDDYDGLMSHGFLFLVWWFYVTRFLVSCVVTALKIMRIRLLEGEGEEEEGMEIRLLEEEEGGRY